MSLVMTFTRLLFDEYDVLLVLAKNVTDCCLNITRAKSRINQTKKFTICYYLTADLKK